MPISADPSPKANQCSTHPKPIPNSNLHPRIHPKRNACLFSPLHLNRSPHLRLLVFFFSSLLFLRLSFCWFHFRFLLLLFFILFPPQIRFLLSVEQNFSDAASLYFISPALPFTVCCVPMLNASSILKHTQPLFTVT